MKFENTGEDLKILMELTIFKSIKCRVFNGMIQFMGLILAIFIIVKYIVMENYNDFKFNLLNYDIDLFIYGIIIIYIIIIIFCLIICRYLLFNLYPKLLRNLIKTDSNKIFAKNKIFHCEKKVTIDENLIKFIYDNKESKIIIKKNTRLIKFKNCVFICEIIMKNIPIKIYPLIIPIERLSKEDIKFISDLKLETLSFN